MRKAIILTLILACIALFAVGCQQQPQAGEAFRLPKYDPRALEQQTAYYPPTDYAAQPYYPEEPMMLGEERMEIISAPAPSYGEKVGEPTQQQLEICREGLLTRPDGQVYTIKMCTTVPMQPAPQMGQTINSLWYGFDGSWNEWIDLWTDDSWT
ncbi:hypothetical protein KY338_00020 [Candidatus Woesearchaeota archaeon]|nr:hypothetical protein [Candidatus Woesearchaeota archaeon]MBW3005293.1 hypothetical protein [Candidatus Woesearchaeota archaeon]